MAKIGVIHYNFPGFTFQQFLKFCADTGYQYVELQLPDVCDESFKDAEQKAGALRKELASYGLKTSALAAQNDFVQLEESAVRHQVERMKRVAQLTKILDEDAVIRSEGGQPKDSVPMEKLLPAMEGCFSRCVDFADKLGVNIAIDNHGLITNDGEMLLALLRKLNHKRIGTNLDTMNYRWYGHDVATCNHFYDVLAPYLMHTHFKDGTGSRKEYKGAALGDGEIDLKHMLNCLKRVGYKGVYCAEYEGPETAGGVGYAKCCGWLKDNA
ncbi:MAG TPA: sugar phosphate isomerase/epimerase [Planctomycetota bacterium]